MPNMFSDKKKTENTHIYTDICIHIQKKKGERTTCKFKTTKLPMIHTYAHTKKDVSETQNHSNTNTHIQL